MLGVCSWSDLERMEPFSPTNASHLLIEVVFIKHVQVNIGINIIWMATNVIQLAT
jgi:hypothetical protein